MTLSLSQMALDRCEALLPAAERWRVAVDDQQGARLIDCGVHAAGGLEAGRWMAELCLAGLGQVEIVTGDANVWPGPAVTVRTDQPVAACLAAQYAGWKISGENYFAMGSGPMRAVYGNEAIYDEIGFRERPQRTLGVLESDKLPPAAVCRQVAERCGLEPQQLTLVVARTASLAGSIQVVARSVETALHKLHELEFPLDRIRAGFGVAPLPPVAATDLEGIGRTNDAVLYGAHVTLWVDGDDETIESLGPQTPSSASRDYGQTFGNLFRQYDCDFYRIDPLLFSPAQVTFINVGTGRVQRFGQLRPDILQSSFGI